MKPVLLEMFYSRQAPTSKVYKNLGAARGAVTNANKIMYGESMLTAYRITQLVPGAVIETAGNLGTQVPGQQPLF